jgi:hypothetical protein
MIGTMQSSLYKSATCFIPSMTTRKFEKHYHQPISLKNEREGISAWTTAIAKT